MRRRTVGLLVLLGLAIGAVGLYAFYRPTVPPQVQTARITEGDVVEAVGATGTLEAVTTVQVGTQVSGTVSALYADYNSIVHKGQVIARLDPSLFETQIEQAKANLLKSQADVERLKVALTDAQVKGKRAEDLARTNLIAQQDLDSARVAVQAAQAEVRSAQAQVTQAQASLNQNQVNLDHSIITAPIDGIVIARSVDVGQTVAASMQAPTLFVLAADLTKMRVNTNVDEADVGRIRPDQLARFRVDAFPTEEFIGKVSQIRLQPVVQQNVVTYSTVVEVSNPQYKLKPGMTATISIEIARREHVLRVPTAALRFRPTEEMFLALNQQVPPELTRGAGGGDSAMAPRRGSGGRSGQDPAGTDGAGISEAAAKTGAKTDGGKTAPAAPGVDRLKKAQTIDTLFGALPPEESSGRVWLFDGDQMKATRLRLGISDGSVTEIRGGPVAANAEVVTAIVLPASTQTRGIGGATGNPLLGNQQRPGQPGGRTPAGGRPGGR